jgi:DNA-binding Lrp family transcriptional regulator
MKNHHRVVTIRPDAIDNRIMELLFDGKNNSEISKKIGVPLSTVQRRVRKLQLNGIMTNQIQLDYRLLGFRTGLIHIFVKMGDIHEIAQRILSLDKVTFVEIYIGDSDILAHVIYEENIDLLNLITKIKNIRGVEKTSWSERVYQSSQKYPLHNLFD